MKKNFKYYLTVWGLLLALFNLVTFVVPNPAKFTDSFWIGYGFIMAAFVGQLVCAIMAFKDDEYKIAFYNITLLTSSFAGLVASFIAGLVCILIPLVYWIAIVICAVVLVLNAIAIVKAKVAIDAVESVDQKIKTQTFFIKSITIDAETLMAKANDDEIKAECRKVAEALRYSDPMSNDALSSVESQITVKFADFSAAVTENDTEKTVATAKDLLVLIGDRNKKCKLLK